MGLSSKQVSGEAFNWGESLMQTGTLELSKVTPVRQQQLQQSGPPLKCPRCDSTHTKFCYFNNYNQSQPRHFCKSCKRHWTKGGTLRDVPVGGGRKNKRLKTNNATTSTTTTSINNNRCNSYKRNGNRITKVAVQSPQQQKLSLELNEEKKFYDILCQSLFQPTSSLLPLSQPSDVQNSLVCSTESMHSVVPLPNLLSFNYLSSFETPFELHKELNYSSEAKLSEDLITRTNTTTATTMTPMPVQLHTPTPRSAIDSSSYWNLEDFNTFMSTDAKEPWDDSFEQQ